MADETYAHFGRRIHKVNPGVLDEKRALGLEELLTGPGSRRRDELIEAFCRELKILLETDDLSELIEGVFSLEQTLNVLRDREGGEDLDFLRLDGLHRQLSPLVLRLALENPAGEDFTLGLREALRVALEEEIYIWQEKIG